MTPKVRWVIGCLFALTLVAGSVALRRYVSSTQPPLAVGVERRPLAASTRPVTRLRPESSKGTLGYEALGDESQHPEQRSAALDRGASEINAKVQTPGPTVTGAFPEPGERASTEAAASKPAPETPGTVRSSAEPALLLSFADSAIAADQTAPLIQQDLQFDPRGGAAVFPPTAVLAYPESGGVDPQEGTIGLWVRKEEGFNETEGRGLTELVTGTWENRFQLGMGPTYVRFLMATSDGVEHGVGGGANWPEGEWHHLAITWGQALMSLYIDGAVADQRPYEGSVNLPASTPLYIASSSRDTQKEGGTISMRGFVVLQQAAGLDEIANVLSDTAPQS